jgi:hypothetical protein
MAKASSQMVAHRAFLRAQLGLDLARLHAALDKRRTSQQLLQAASANHSSLEIGSVANYKGRTATVVDGQPKWRCTGRLASWAYALVWNWMVDAHDC